MAIYGYHRTSTTDQHLDRGIVEITEYCKKNNLKLKKVVTDQQTGKNFERPGYKSLKEFADKDDIIILSELDRLGRNKAETLKELQYFRQSGIRVAILEIPTTLMDYSSMGNDLASMMMETINNLLIEMYATLAHAEMQKQKKRQKEGIQAKKDRHEWDNYGRPSAIDFEVFKREYAKVLTGELKPFECMRKLGMTKPTFYRYKNKLERPQANDH